VSVTTKKIIQIQLDDARIYEIDAHEVAHDRATHYAENDPDTTYESEYEHTMTCRGELEDWLFNNMDWHKCETLVLTQTKFDRPQDRAVLETHVYDRVPYVADVEEPK
jgi:hypothetical protein